MKFNGVGRCHLQDSFRKLRGDEPCAKWSLKYLRPSVRALIMKVTAGVRFPPELIRIVLSGCVKVAALRSVVYTIPTKAEGLRIQTSDIILGEPGVGKGQSYR